MAGAGISCQFCESRSAEVLMTWLSNGATVAACPEDLAPALINVLAVDLGVEPGPFYAHVKRFVDKAVKAEAAGAAKDTSGGDSPGRAPDAGESTTAPADHPLVAFAQDVARAEQRAVEADAG